MRHDEEYQVLVGKPDFALGWVDVHIEVHVGHVEEQYGDRLALGPVGLVRLRHGLADELALEGPVPHEQELVVALAVCLGDGGDVAGNVNLRFGVVDGQEVFRNARTDGFGKAVLEFARNANEYGFVADLVVKADFGVRDGGPDDNVQYAGAFGSVAAEESPADGRIEEKVFYKECRSPACLDVLLFDDFAPFQYDTAAFAVIGGAGNRHFGYGGNRSHGFAAETVCMQVEKIVCTVQFGRSVAEVADVQVCLAHAFPVVGNEDFLFSALFNLDLNTGCSRIYGIFNKFFYCGCRALYDLSGGDFVNDFVG